MGIQAAVAGTADSFSASQDALNAALTRYREIARAGGWPAVPDGPALRPGASGPAVAALRKRLTVTGDLMDGAGDPRPFDAGLADAVERFQARHGLLVDGIVGRHTRKALNMPAEARVRQIAANLARLRSLPVGEEARFILINVAGFDLALFEDGRPVIRSPVIVGRLSRPTPVFSSTVTRIIVNPYWRVPRRIAVVDILPKVKRDPSYLSAQSIRVYANNHGEPKEVAPDSIDWRALHASNFPYLLVQDPGPLNALGRIKFFIPNEMDVYLHDTPAKELFKQPRRTFSSGCIRVEKARDLAELLLRADNNGRLETLEDALKTGETTEIPLVKPVPVHVVYLTAWVDADGQVEFRDDVYGLDGLSGAGLDKIARLRRDALACAAPANLGGIHS